MSSRLGFVLQPSYRLRRGRPVVQLFGVLEGGEPFLVEDDRFRPYFFVPVDAQPALAGAPNALVEPCELRDLSGRPLARVVATIPGDVPSLRRRVEEAGGSALEADVRFAYRYLIDRGIRASVRIDGEGAHAGSRLLRFRNPELAPAEFRPKLSVLSLDLETTPDASRILSAALAGCGVEEVHLVAATPVAGAQVHPDERALLRALEARVRELDPDVLTGWNVVDFDLRVLEQRARRLGLAFAIGRAEGPIRLQTDRGFTRQSRADVPGRQVLDGVALVRDAFIPLDDYRLETAARHVLGRGKRIEGSGPDHAREIQRLWREDPAALVDYNLEDARLVLEILEHEALVELAIERSLLCGMQLDRVGASIASFDLVYLPELRRRGFAAPSVDPERKHAQVLGGAVLESHPGLFANVAVFDFKSLYPSLIRTFNLDPLAHARAAGEGEVLVAPNGARFSRAPGILPVVLDRFFERRGEARARGDRHADLAIKIMMNALFGVLGAASCRFFDPAVANAITAFGQQTLRWARSAFEAEGVRVLYGDTDSIFAALDPAAAPADAEREARRLRDAVQVRVAERIGREYRVEPRLELELEHVYRRFFQPRLRHGRQGSKKRYAGLVGDELQVVGLEAVRRDTPAVARRLQLGMLERVFQDRPVEPFVRDLVERVLRGELDAELVIRKGVRKGALERYTATTPPHVKAARKAARQGGGDRDRVIRYVMTSSGPEPVAADGALPPHLDRRHYVDRVLRPIADAILEHLDTSVDAVLGAGSQLSLL